MILHLLGPQVKLEGDKKNSRGDINEQCKINAFYERSTLITIYLSGLTSVA